ncbi:hypothetical protein JB92DRAFT_2864419 [Gautieria morchelliformis]|nr:hypothetical protein JB92DRAFT_2864419 [Gautieria morchelliformis]
MDLTSPLPFRHQREARMPKPLEIPTTVLPREPDDIDSQLGLYPRSNSPPNSTPPPRSPLPPHKLAKIANALGVNTPMPAFFRSPSPSGSSSLRTPSRYLLHVVPPIFLPSDEDDDGSDPDGASAVSSSSYRSQFRRGTLIPLYPTLHSQLGAIAREYNLPSTGGLVLYLAHSPQDAAQEGPRITEDVWKLLWHKALQAERQDSQPRSISAFNMRSGRSTPASPFTSTRDVSQPLPSTPRIPSSPYPSPYTSSMPSSEVHLPLFDKDPSSTPDLGSFGTEFTPNAFLPILGKIEFDIDRRKASWFDGWIHGKRERSRWRSASEGGRLALELPERARSRSHLRPGLQTRTPIPSESGDYMALDDDEGEKTAGDDDQEQEGQATVALRNIDPLADVFGNDATTWGEIRREHMPTGTGVISPYPELVIPLDVKVRDEDEVIKLWNENKRPKLSLNPPDPRASSSRKGAPPPLNIQTTPDSTLRLPPTTKSHARNPSNSSSAGSEKFSGTLMKRRTGMVFGDLEVKIVAEPEPMTEKEAAHRSSQIVMKHKLDQLEKELAHLSPRQLNEHQLSRMPSEGFQDSPLRSAPPGVDRFNLSPPKHVKGARSFNPSSRRPEMSETSTPITQQVGDAGHWIPPRKDSLSATSQTSHSRPARLQQHTRARSSQSSSGSSSKSHHEPPPGVAWPSSSHAPLPSPSSPPATRPNVRRQERSPPQLTLKRASAGQQKVEVSEETLARSLDDDNDLSHSSLSNSTLTGNLTSPVIPLSPDPFGKRPLEDLRPARLSNESTHSAESRPLSRLQGTVLPPSVPENAEGETQTSRFSADSEQGFEQLSKQRRQRSNSVMSVRGIRNFWRKSTMPSKSTDVPPPVPREPNPPLPPHALSLHSRAESSLSQRSVQTPTDRVRRPSTTLRPDSGMDPFQFDNTNIYKSASSSSLASATTLVSSGANYASATGSIGRSKGILKGRPGNAKSSDAEAQRMRHPSPERSMSTASASLSDLGERSTDSQQSSPPSSPPDADAHPVSMRHKPPMDNAPLSHSLPTASAMGLSRYPEALPSKSSPGPSFDVGTISQLSEFEIVSLPTHSTPSSSYTGKVY